MVSCDVFEPLTVTVPAVPAVTKPADTVGVTDLVALAVAVITPVLEFTDIVGLAVTVVAGVVAEPLGMVTDTLISLSSMVSAVSIVLVTVPLASAVYSTSHRSEPLVVFLVTVMSLAMLPP